LKKGFTITSRGCPNKCWFCSVWKTEGRVIRQLEIKPGWKIQDNNLLACSRKHIEAVFKMLKEQGRAASFPGGIEAARLRDWHIELLQSIKIKEIWLADDEPREHAVALDAIGKLAKAGFKRHQIRCYAFCAYRGDTMAGAQSRLEELRDAGCDPFAMIYGDNPEWQKFKRFWQRPAIYRQARPSMIRTFIRLPEPDPRKRQECNNAWREITPKEPSLRMKLAVWFVNEVNSAYWKAMQARAGENE
jgi:hypothetical protein